MLKAAKGKQQIIYKGIPIRLSADFSAETQQARREWHDIFKLMRGKKPCNWEYSTQRAPHLDFMEKSKILQSKS